MLRAGSGTYGTSRYLVRNLAQNINTTIQQNGSIYHQLRAGNPETHISDLTGQPIEFTELRASDNGKWLLGDSHQKGMYRINVETGETLLFQSGYNHAIGIRPYFITNISDDGRFVLVAEQSYQILKLYDLATCVQGQDNTKPANCNSKDLFSAAKSSIPLYRGIHHIRFSGPNTIQLHVLLSNSSYAYYSMTAAGENESLLDYLALGDSFASGEGAHNYKSGTDNKNPLNVCHLSSVSYPYLLKEFRSSSESVACSGAKLKDIINNDYNEWTAQSKGKNESTFTPAILGRFLPGYRPQIKFVEHTRPNTVTISISGNDIGFGKIITACLAPSTCYESPQEKADLAHTINSKYQEMVDAFIGIKQKSATNASVHVLGYPLLVYPGGNCAINVQFNNQELSNINAIIYYLNNVIQKAANKAGVSFISLENSLDGHRLCETDSKNIAVNGITAGDDKTFSFHLANNYIVEGYFIGRETFHPNAFGHRLFAKSIAEQTNNFTIANPEPRQVLEPNPTDIAQFAGGSNIQPRLIRYDEKLTENLLNRNSPIPITIYDLRPSSSVTLSAIGKTFQTLTADSSGKIVTNINLPSLPIGLATIHAHGQSVSGDEIDIQKTVYLTDSADDLDGDLVPNSDEGCYFVESSGHDSDADLIDDSCDGYLGDTPKMQTEQLTSSHTSLPVSSVATNIPTALSPLLKIPRSIDTIRSPAVLSASTPLHQPSAMARSEPDGFSQRSSRQRHLRLLVVLAVVFLVMTYLLFRWRRNA